MESGLALRKGLLLCIRLSPASPVWLGFPRSELGATHYIWSGGGEPTKNVCCVGWKLSATAMLMHAPFKDAVGWKLSATAMLMHAPFEDAMSFVQPPSVKEPSSCAVLKLH